MSVVRTAWLKYVAVAIVAATLGASFQYFQKQHNSVQASQQRPEFSLPDLEEKQRSIDEWDGKLLLINFWASWCPPCIKEMPALDQLRLEYEPHGFEIVGIAVEPIEDAISYLADRPVSYPILYGEYSATAIGQQYGNDIGSIPFSALIDRNGLIVERYYGEIDLSSLNETVSRLINT